MINRLKNLEFDPKAATPELISDDLLAKLTESASGWYSLPDGNKARGKDAAKHALAGYLRKLAEEQDGEAGSGSPTTWRRKYANAPTLPEGADPTKQRVGSIFYVLAGTPIPETGRTFKPNQPVTVIRCYLCDTKRALHLQDVPQAAGRCVTCIKDERRGRARKRAAQRREARKAAAASK